MNTSSSQRGFALLIALVLTSVLLAVALALINVSYKQIVLALTTKQSNTAFYNADTALECALYYDQQNNAFDYDSGSASQTLTCAQKTMTTNTTLVTSPNDARKTTFSIPCGGSGSDAAATVTIYKSNSGSCTGAGGAAVTCIYATGYSDCSATAPRRLERGLKVLY